MQKYSFNPLLKVFFSKIYLKNKTDFFGSTSCVFMLFILLTGSAISTTIVAQKKDKFIIVLDAGHGGKDPGKKTLKYNEKDIALKIVLKIGKQLALNKNVKVIYTRKTDVFVKLHERARIANKADADLFVSIHCNAHHTQASGTETFVLGEGNTQRNLTIAKAENEVIFLEDDHSEHYERFDPNSPESLIGLTLMQEEYVAQSLLLASLIEKNFVQKDKRKSRGVKQASLLLMHSTYMPSVLIETGFITNEQEGEYLVSKNGQVSVAKSIANAILTYKNKLHLVEDEIIDPIIENPTETNPIIVTQKNIIFKVQLAASNKKIALKSYNFKKMENLSIAKTGKLYRYFSGSTNNYKKIKEIQKKAIKKGHTTAYIVAYKNGKQIPLAEALK